VNKLKFVLLAPLVLCAQNLKEFEKKVTEFSLPNGLHFIVMERHEAPVVSFHTHVNAGSGNDPAGATGLAHMLEHMAFKGTESIGTRDWAAEKKALEDVEEIYDRLQEERNKGPKANPAKVMAAEGQLRLAIDAAQAFVQPNEYARVIEENGGVGLNAGTGIDATEYFYSLPSNRIELWFLLESQRFLHSVFREFYKERAVVMEEYRQRVESNPQGRLMQNLLSASYAAHSYRNPPGGWPGDIAELRVAQARQFFQEYYVPGNMTMAIVGDANPAEAKRLAEKYFGAMPARPMPPLLHTTEPPQPGPKSVTVNANTQPVAAIAYKRPDFYDKDDAVFAVMQLMFSGGRTGLLYRDLVEQKRIALNAQAVAVFPAGRYTNLFVFFLVPSAGHTVQENEKALNDMIAGLQQHQVSEVVLSRAKTQARAAIVRLLANNAGLAGLLSGQYANFGDWRRFFTNLDELDKVSADDVQRVITKYLVPDNRTIAFTPGGTQ